MMPRRSRLKEAPEDIDLVILTHDHPDHIGGNTFDDGQLAFPNARYAMWKEEWAFWTSKEAEEKALVFAPHFPFPGLGSVVPKGQAWIWESIDANV